MLRSFDFECPTHGRFEKLVSIPPLENGVMHDHRRNVQSHACPTCGADSPVQFAAPMVNPKYLAFKGDLRRRNT